MTREIEAPSATVLSFEQDDVGDWVARLSCGHSQHVRHQPPWLSRPWVTTEEGRRCHVGIELNCQLCRMPSLPADVQEYKRTREFDADTIPAGLLRDHRTKAGVWATIVVLEGYLGYRIQDEQQSYFMLRPGVDGIVAPNQPHHVVPQPGTRFYVAFWRHPENTDGSDDPHQSLTLP